MILVDSRHECVNTYVKMIIVAKMAERKKSRERSSVPTGTCRVDIFRGNSILAWGDKTLLC